MHPTAVYSMISIESRQFFRGVTKVIIVMTFLPVIHGVVIIKVVENRRLKRLVVQLNKSSSIKLNVSTKVLYDC